MLSQLRFRKSLGFSYQEITRYVTSNAGPGRGRGEQQQQRVASMSSGHRRVPTNKTNQPNENTIQLPRVVACYQPLLVRIFNDLQGRKGDKDGPLMNATDAVSNMFTLSTNYIKQLQINIGIGRKTSYASKSQQQQTNDISAAKLREFLELSEATLDLTPAEWSAFCSSLIILKPKNARLWALLDEAIAKSVRADTQHLVSMTMRRRTAAGGNKSQAEATQLMDSLLLRMHCMRESTTEAPTASWNKKHSFNYKKRDRNAGGPLTAHAIALAFQKLHKLGDLETLLRAPYSGLKAEPARDADARHTRIHGYKGSTPAEAEAAAAAAAPKYVSPFAAVNSHKGSWAPKTYDTTAMTMSSTLPALERITLCLGVLDWALSTTPKTSQESAVMSYLRNVVVCNAWYHQARQCITESSHVPLHALLYSWEALAGMPTELRRSSNGSGSGGGSGSGSGGGQTRHLAVGAEEEKKGQDRKKPGPVVDADGMHELQLQSQQFTSEAAYTDLTAVLAGLVEKDSANANANGKMAEEEEDEDSGDLPMTATAVNKLLLFQTLYSLVKSSLSNSPHQLSEGRSGDFSQADLSILESLMQSMITSGIKSTELIKSVGDLCERNEFFSWYGKKALLLFDQLVALEENVLALRVLEQYHRQSSEGKGLDILGTSYFPSELSQAALQLIWKELNHKLTSPQTRFTAGDTVLALSIFSRVDQIPANAGAGAKKSASRGVQGNRGATTSTSNASHANKESKYTRMLASVEAQVVQQLTEQLNNSTSQTDMHTQWTPKDCSQVLSCYGKVGRLHPTMVDLLNRLLGSFFHSGDPNLLPVEFSSIVHANARLNHRPSFLKAMGAVIIEPYKLRADMVRKDSNRSKNWTNLNYFSIKSFISVLWSLSVLECLDEKTYDSIQPLLEMVHEHGGGVRLEGFIRTALDQISLDQQFVRGTFQKSGMRNDIDGHFYNNKSVEVISSRLHQDVSISLNGMGVSHQNEAVLNNGYTADIFIPPSSDFSNFVYSRGNALSADYRHHSSSVGTVIEIDGPGHFETYMMRPLGKTAMKQRHIRQAGYNLISLPYWSWPFNDGHDEKKEMLVQLLKHSCAESTKESK